MNIRSFSKKTTSFILSGMTIVSMIFSVVPTTFASTVSNSIEIPDVPEVPNTLQTLNVSKPLIDADYTDIFNINEASVSIEADGTYLINGNNVSTTNNISVATGVKAYITLKDVNVSTNAAFYCNSNASVTVNIVGSNVLASTGSGSSGICIPDNGYLVICSDDNVSNTLNVVAGANAAGIGPNDVNTSSPGDIFVTGGTVVAQGNWGAGIGGSGSGDVRNIVITDGIISASIKNYRAAGIGGGNNSSVTNGIFITGGNIISYSAENGAGIGGGAGYDKSSYVKDIVITGGTITATSNNSGSGIGTGSNNNSISGGIYILDGTITAVSNRNGAGIGSIRTNTINDIFISGGEINAAGSSAPGIGTSSYLKITSSPNISALSNINGKSIAATAILADLSVLQFNFKNYISGNSTLILSNKSEKKYISVPNSIISMAVTVNNMDACSLLSTDGKKYIGTNNNVSYMDFLPMDAVTTYNDLTSEYTKIFLYENNSDIISFDNITDYTLCTSFGQKLSSLIPSYTIKDNDYIVLFDVTINGVTTEYTNVSDMDTIITNSSDIKLTLKPDYRNKYTITFDNNNGEKDNLVSIKKGSAVTKPDNPIYAFHKFEGWYTETGVLWDFSTVPETNVKLIAKWSIDADEDLSKTAKDFKNSIKLPDTLKLLNKTKPMSDNEYTQSWNIEDNPIIIIEDGTYLVYGYNNETENNLVVASGVTAYITLRNINTVSYNPILIKDHSKVTLNIEGNNICTGTNAAGIFTPDDGYCEITADNTSQTISITGVDTGLGINTNATTATGDIFITGGKLSVNASSHGYFSWLPEIGGTAIGASSASINNIVITDGDITADGSSTAIGSNSCGGSVNNIIITGGNISAFGNRLGGANTGPSGAVIGASSGNAGLNKYTTSSIPSSVGNIYILGGTINATSVGGSLVKSAPACIGAGRHANSHVGDIVISSADVKASYADGANCSGIGSGAEGVGKSIILLDSKVNSKSTVGSAIGSGGAPVDDIIIKNCNITAVSDTGAGIGGGESNTINADKVVNKIVIIDSNVSAWTTNGSHTNNTVFFSPSGIGGGGVNANVGDINIKGSIITVPKEESYKMASGIGGGVASNTGDISIADTKIDIKINYDFCNSFGNKSGAAIGGGTDGSSVGNIILNNVSGSILSPFVGIGAGTGSSKVKDILIENGSDLNISSSNSITALGSKTLSNIIGATEGEVKNISIIDSTINGTGTAGIGSVNTSTTGDITISGSKIKLITDTTSLGNNASEKMTNAVGNISVSSSTLKLYSKAVTIGENNENSSIKSLSIFSDTDLQAFSTTSSAISKDMLDNTDNFSTIYQGTFATPFSEDKTVLFNNSLTKDDIIIPTGYITFAVLSQGNTWNYVVVDDEYYKGYMTVPEKKEAYTINYYTKSDIITKYVGLTPAEYSIIKFNTDNNLQTDIDEIKVLSGDYLPYYPTISSNKEGYEFGYWNYEYYEIDKWLSELTNKHTGTLFNQDDIKQWYFEHRNKSFFPPDGDSSLAAGLTMNMDEDLKTFTFTAISQPILCDYTVKYVDTDGNELAPQKTAKDYYNTEITETAIKINNYAPLESTKTITIDFTDNEIVFVYEPHNSERKLTVIVLEADTNLGVKATVDINDSVNGISDTLVTDDNGYASTANKYAIGEEVDLNVSDLNEQYLPVEKVKYIVSSDDDIIYIYVNTNDKFIITGYNDVTTNLLKDCGIIAVGVLGLFVLYIFRKKRK